jgi:uncharacterized protein (DUF305 family)
MNREIFGAFAAAVAAFALVGAGCGGDDDASSSAGDTQPVPFDRAFIDAMVPHHQQAIEMAKDAKAAGLSAPALVDLADAIMTTQQGEIDRMKKWREQWFGSAATDPHGADTLGMTMEEMGMHQGRMDFSAEKDVDAAFASMMIAHHEGAIAMATLARERGQHDEITALADDIIAAQQDEIDVMKEFAGAGGHDMSGMESG